MRSTPAVPVHKPTDSLPNRLSRVGPGPVGRDRLFVAPPLLGVRWLDTALDATWILPSPEPCRTRALECGGSTPLWRGRCRNPPKRGRAPALQEVDPLRGKQQA